MRGFTLIEFLVVMMLVGMLMAGVAYTAASAVRQAIRHEARTYLEELRLRAQFYRLEHGRYPTGAQEIEFEMPSNSRWQTPAFEASEGQVRITLALRDNPARRCLLVLVPDGAPASQCNF